MAAADLPFSPRVAENWQCALHILIGAPQKSIAQLPVCWPKIPPLRWITLASREKIPSRSACFVVLDIAVNGT